MRVLAKQLRAVLVEFFFFIDQPSTQLYTLSLHDALPICTGPGRPEADEVTPPRVVVATLWSRPLVLRRRAAESLDRKSTRLNSSHTVISYAVFCLKKKRVSKLQAELAMIPAKHIESYEVL